MNKLKLLSISLMIVPFLIGCQNGQSKKFITFHQEGKDDVVIEFNETTTNSEIQAKEPELTIKEGYYSSWEKYDVTNKDKSFTVNAIFTPITYYVDFKAQGVLVASVPFTINDISGEHSKLPDSKTPQVPAYSWCDPYWEDYSLSLNNIIVNAKYDKLVDFNVTFMADGEKIGDTISINKSMLNGDGQIRREYIPSSVFSYKKQYCDVIWDFVIKEAKDTIITAQTPFHAYKMKFVDFDGNQVGDLVPYFYNSTWATINKPAPLELPGYNCSWNEVALTFSDIDLPVSTPKKTGKEYVVTFDDGITTQRVIYGEEYHLINKTSATKKYEDDDGNIIPNDGIWVIANNVTLHLINVTRENFDSPFVPSFIDKDKSYNIKSIQIAEGEGINGTNALKFVVNADNNFGLYISKDYLDDIFSDSNVKSLNFVAKSNIHNNNFRHRTNSTNVCYELNDSKWGIETIYKKFSFTRAMYLNHMDDGDFVIYGGVGSSGSCAGEEIFIDSFIFDEDDVIASTNTLLGFENGFTRENGSNYCYYMTPNNTEYNLFISHNGRISSFGYNYQYFTEGMRSLTFVKDTGYIALYLPVFFKNNVVNSASKTFAFDMYSTVAINSTSSVKNLQNGVGGVFNTQHPKDKWCTYTIDNTGLTSDGRFLIIQGSSQGTYYFDNFRIL